MDALPNDEPLRMEEFSVQPMPISTPMPWENFGIMMNPFQNPMQMMRQVYPLPAQLQQQDVVAQVQQPTQQVQEQQHELLPEQQLPLLAHQIEQQQVLLPEQQLHLLLPQQEQLLTQQQHQFQQEQQQVLFPPQLLHPQQQVQLVERKPTPAAPQGPDAIRNKLREAFAEALKMVAAEQPKEEVSAFLDSPKAEEVVAIRTSSDAEVCDSLEHHEFQFPPPVIIRKPRSKLQAHGGKGSPLKRMRIDSSTGDGVDHAWELRVANHAKLLARNIELELLRMFRDVNKKYREKARSLKFNLADKNNPELRARVFVGEITPQVLCNMTIEQLASKELSEWRMAKAEERAHMVVITDDDVNTSKLVKKTHKGEFIMEVDSDAAPDVLVPAGSSAKEESEGSEEADVPKEDQQQQQVDDIGSSEEQTGVENTAVEDEEAPAAPSEAAPVADGEGGGEPAEETADFEENSDVLLDVSDFKGLPEIMSMDGYLKSVGSSHKEDGTPFEDDDTKLKVVNEELSDPNIQTFEVPVPVPVPVPVVVAEREKSPEEEEKENATTSVQPVGNPLKRKQPEEPSPIRERSSSPRLSNDRGARESPKPTTDDSPNSPRREKLAESAGSLELWDGSLQLTGTRSTAVRAVFRSGHNVKLDAWPKSLGVKGRVKVDHLAKFLKELGSSKSRTVTGLSFYSSDMATSSLSLLKEVVDGYEKGERVGYVVPAPGFELYLLPPGESSWKLLSENGRLKPGDESGIPKDRSEVLVGCVVWRKSPSGSSSQSDKSKKAHSHSSSSSSSKSKTASRTKHSSTLPASSSLAQAAPASSSSPMNNSSLPASVTFAPPVTTTTTTTTFGFPSSSPPMSLQQSSQSVVVKHPVNEWHQSSLCPMPPVGADSVVAAPVPGAPPFSLGGLFFPPGFSALANNNNNMHQHQQQQQQVIAGAMLSGLEGGGPPGFRQHCPITSLDDLPDYDDLLTPSAPPLSYGLSTSFTPGVGSYNNSSHHQVVDGFLPRGFQPNQVTCALPEPYRPPPDAHNFGVPHQHPDWRASHGVGAPPVVTSAQHVQQQQPHHQQQQQQQPNMFMASHLLQQVQHGPPPLPPGPPPPPRPFGQWMHPNQAAHQHHKPSSLHYKRPPHSNGSRRYRS